MISKKNIALAIVVVVIVGVVTYIELQKPPQLGSIESTPVDLSGAASESIEQKIKNYPVAQEIVAPAGFINTNEIKIQELIGKKVILIDFWTYSCINCQRTLPYITSWYEKYRNQGLEIIGVHTPEFEFEKDINNVQAAVDKWGVNYPVVLDNDYGTWRAYKNRYWPRKYLIDIDGFVVYDHIGEGSYEETERKIQELLSERMTVLDEQGSIDTSITKPSNVEEVDFGQPRTPELYFGFARNQYLGNGKSGRAGDQDFSVPKNLKTDLLYLDGSWNLQSEYAKNLSSGARIVLPYQGQKVFIVARADKPIKARLLIDGQPLGVRAGQQVAADSTVTIEADQLYRLVEDSQWDEHTLEIIIEEPGVQAFAFTFG